MFGRAHVWRLKVGIIVRYNVQWSCDCMSKTGEERCLVGLIDDFRSLAD